jgi:cell wall-associated NlpC family hydrolase
MVLEPRREEDVLTSRPQSPGCALPECGVGRTEPKPGDIAIFNWDGGAPDHIGIVEKNLGNGQFVSIEGNTAIGNDSNGGEVMRRQRHIVQVDGFGRVTVTT